jgi:hypothetical protein
VTFIRRDYYFTQREWDRVVGYGKVPKERELGDLIEDEAVRKLMSEKNGCNCPDCLEGHCLCTAKGECQDCLCEKCG